MIVLLIIALLIVIAGLFVLIVKLDDKNKIENRQREEKKKSLKAELERALKREEFVVYLQPKFWASNEKLAGAEALVRWEHPNKGFLLPNAFVPDLEECGLIEALDTYVLKQVCKKQSQWKKKNYIEVPIAVNESKAHLFNSEHPEALISILEEYGVSPHLIELEMTESTVVHNIEEAKQAERRVHELGFCVSMDDFGTGYSSFSMLKDIHIDILKMDKSFFNGILTNKRAKAIVESVIQMAKRLDIKTVAEGIETEEQVEYLKSIGCDIIQGYYFSKPIPIDEFEKKYLITE